MQRRTLIGGKGERASACRWGARGQGEDGVIAVYLSARSTSKSSAVKPFAIQNARKHSYFVLKKMN
jgi:hypothetical protein